MIFGRVFEQRPVSNVFSLLHRYQRFRDFLFMLNILAKIPAKDKCQSGERSCSLKCESCFRRYSLARAGFEKSLLQLAGDRTNTNSDFDVVIERFLIRLVEFLPNPNVRKVTHASCSSPSIPLMYFPYWTSRTVVVITQTCRLWASINIASLTDEVPR